MKKYFILFIGIVCVLCLQNCNTIYVQQKGLYEGISNSDSNSLDGFKAVYIFKDDIDKSVWVSKETQCVNMNLESTNKYADKSAMHIKWDKVTGGCNWIGCGFGWNNWVPKNMSDIVETAAVQLQVKSVNGTFSNLPVAFAFEDYNGVQAYYGFNKSLVTKDFNDTTWTSVTIPLSKFEFDKKDFNAESVKQFMIQLEGDGDIYLDNIKLIRL
jgi:hypothetical protein